ncbi:MAG: Putative Transposase, partial [Microgenomates bacterium 39_6]
MKNITQITLAWELHKQGLSNIKISGHVDRHRETIGIWI